MKEGEVSEAIRTPQGYAFITVTGRQDAYVPKLDEVKAKVRDEFLNEKAIERARAAAAAAAPALKSGDFDKAAKGAGLDVKTTDLIARGTSILDLGSSPSLDEAAFGLKEGGVSDPVVTDRGAAIVKVLERKDATSEDAAKEKASIRNDMLAERKARFFGAYMTKARQRMTIRTHPETIAQIIG
jgi:parvulin-like peptidyl-prolyl isomerase